MPTSGLMETSKVRSCCQPESADLTMDALHRSRYSAGRGIGLARRAPSRSLGSNFPKPSSRRAASSQHRDGLTSTLVYAPACEITDLPNQLLQPEGCGYGGSRATPPASDLTAETSLPSHAGDNSWSTEISCSSMRSVGARMNTSHIMSGCCWLPLMKPITCRPVARSMTASKRWRISS
jgi:hypothetical protein